MVSRAKRLWVIAGVALIAAAALAVGQARGLRPFGWTTEPDVVAGVTLVFTAIAAVASVAGAILTGRGNRTSDEQQTLIASDIRRLAELTEASIEEARALRPEPAVRFLLDDGPTDKVVGYRTVFRQEIDVEQILATEKEVAEETLQRMEEQLNPGSSFTTLAAVRLASWGSITDSDRSEFADDVDAYVRSLRDWLADFDKWREESGQIFEVDLRFENHGRVPAQDVVVRLEFPDGFEEVEEVPHISRPPKRPVFTKRNPFDSYGTNIVGPISSFTDSMTFPDPPGNVSPPRYRRGSLIVELEIDRLLHGIAEDTAESVIVQVPPEDGEYRVPWEIHAENLSEPAKGELTLQIETETVQGPAVTSLEELLSAFEAE